jgi:hypothetical protein
MSRWLSAALVLLVAVAAGLAALSGGSGADPRTPVGPAGLPAPFLGTAIAGSGGLAVAVDAYGDVVDMRAPGPAGAALIDNPADRQAAGSVPAGTGIVPRVRIGGGPATALWDADSVAQRYLPRTNVVETAATFVLPAGERGSARVEITDAGRGEELARVIRVVAPPAAEVAPALSIHLAAGAGVRCAEERRRHALALLCAPTSAAPAPAAPSFGPATAGRARPVFATVRRTVALAARQDRRWLARARPLGAAAPSWVRRMYRRSLLVLRALIDRRTGAVAAGVRDGWAYVWPRDAATAALALAASGYRSEARRVAHFLSGLDLSAAARFAGDGTPVPGRAAQGDAAGWVAVAEHSVALSPTRSGLTGRRASPWRNRTDYQEGGPGDYLANAIAALDPRLSRAFGSPRGLVRRAGDPASGLDSAAAWAVRPFPQPALFPAVRRTLLSLSNHQSRFGITPSEGWPDADPWTAPTAWSAWSLAALGERRQALRLLADLRRASTPAGDFPERVALRTGIPRSTTPLTWSHAFAILALRQLWPSPKGGV